MREKLGSPLSYRVFNLWNRRDAMKNYFRHLDDDYMNKPLLLWIIHFLFFMALPRGLIELIDPVMRNAVMNQMQRMHLIYINSNKSDMIFDDILFYTFLFIRLAIYIINIPLFFHIPWSRKLLLYLITSMSIISMLPCIISFHFEPVIIVIIIICSLFVIYFNLPDVKDLFDRTNA